MELTKGMLGLLRRVTGKKNVDLRDYHKTIDNLTEGYAPRFIKDNVFHLPFQIKDVVKERFGYSYRIEPLVENNYDACYIEEYDIENLVKSNKDKNREVILCSAIHFNDGKFHVHTPKNISTGYVLCGLRHGSILAQPASLGLDRAEFVNRQKEIIQGFLTSHDRFVDRVEAGKIAFNAGQILDEGVTLHSEDLW